MSLFSALAIVAALSLGAPADGTALTVPPAMAAAVNHCPDYEAVYVDPATGTLYGDQDGDGVLSGADCEWS